MQLAIEHNLTPDELRKAITGMAIGSGIEQEVLDTLLKAKGCDDTPKEPRTRAMRELYAAMQAEFRKAQEDILVYAEIITGLRKSQLSFDFHAPLHLEATTDKTGHVVHRWMAGHHSSPEALPVVEQPQEATTMNLKEQLEAYKPTLEETFKQSAEWSLKQLQEQYGQDLRGKHEGVSLPNSAHYKNWNSKVRPMAARKPDGTYAIDPERAAEKAKEYANATVASWHDKITGKLQDLSNATVHHLDGNRFSITGERNGMKVSIVQDMIVNVSATGTPFNQWPARIYVNKKPVSEAAYKKMTKASE